MALVQTQTQKNCQNLISTHDNCYPVPTQILTLILILNFTPRLEMKKKGEASDSDSEADARDMHDIIQVIRTATLTIPKILNF